uniref:Uncharacterized protein n=1 Tax=Rhizophora mucronata TaxID=61149 RepID=A0A2P2PC32_RHIMU
MGNYVASYMPKGCSYAMLMLLSLTDTTFHSVLFFGIAAKFALISILVCLQSSTYFHLQ